MSTTTGTSLPFEHVAKIILGCLLYVKFINAMESIQPNSESLPIEANNTNVP